MQRRDFLAAALMAPAAPAFSTTSSPSSLPRRSPISPAFSQDARRGSTEAEVSTSSSPGQSTAGWSNANLNSS